MIDPKKHNIGQGETLPEEMWVLFDKSNGNPHSWAYIWWFRKKKDAIEHRNRQNSNKNNATVTGPFQYVLAGWPNE
jgi:hypothetical protein